MKKLFLLLFLTILLSSCTFQKKEISFYHWKSKAKYSDTIKNALSISKTDTIYMHYFDIKNTPQNGINPIYILKEIDCLYYNFNIIPVVFISNSIFNEPNDLERLSEKIDKLITDISIHNFRKEFKTIQLDCDWTQSTKNDYFYLIKLLNQKYKINTTIRLHQIKFKDKTGVPPANKGTLMLYNVGELANEDENSLLETRIVKQYINNKSNYPLILDVALPLYSQTVLINNHGNIKLINDNCKNELLKDSLHFKQQKENLFTVEKDTLFKGFYLSKGFKIKTEKLTEEEIINSYKVVENSKLITANIIFYHLDDKVLNNINLSKIIKKIN